MRTFLPLLFALIPISACSTLQPELLTDDETRNPGSLTGTPAGIVPDDSDDDDGPQDGPVDDGIDIIGDGGLLDITL